MLGHLSWRPRHTLEQFAQETVVLLVVFLLLLEQFAEGGGIGLQDSDLRVVSDDLRGGVATDTQGNRGDDGRSDAQDGPFVFRVISIDRLADRTAHDGWRLAFRCIFIDAHAVILIKRE